VIPKCGDAYRFIQIDAVGQYTKLWLTPAGEWIACTPAGVSAEHDHAAAELLIYLGQEHRGSPTTQLRGMGYVRIVVMDGLLMVDGSPNNKQLREIKDAATINHLRLREECSPSRFMTLLA
jgi:hypothetical protein